MQRTQEHPIGKTFGFPDVPDGATALGYAPNTHPNVPRHLPGYVFRREFQRELLAFLRAPGSDAMCISGPTGAGKTSGVTETLARLYWPCQSVTGHGRLELADLVGQFRLVSERPGLTPSMQFVHGPLPIAMREGHVLLINEFDYIDPGEIAGLNDILEGRPLVIPENGGEVVAPTPMFRVIVTGNSAGAGDESGLHRGVLAQNLAFMDRFRVSKVDYMDPATEVRILESAAPTMPAKLREKLVEVANGIRTQFLGESGMGDGELPLTMSTRTLVRWAGLAMDFRLHPTPLAYALGIALTNRAEPAHRLAIEKIAEGILGDQWHATSKAA